MTKKNNPAPVGILDSDIGGLSVVNEFHRLCPQEDILYFADTAHYPYGTKNAEEILCYFKESAHFLIQRGVKALLCACSTASAVVNPHFQNYFWEIPLIGMLNRELVELTLSSLTGRFGSAERTSSDTGRFGSAERTSFEKNKMIGLIATQLTVKSMAFEKLFQTEALDNAISFHSQDATELVNAVTEGDFSENKITPQLNAIFKTFPLSRIGALIIGCTHFYHLREQLRSYISPIPLIEPSKVASLCLKKKLEDNHQMHSLDHRGKIECFVSGDMRVFEKRVRALEKTHSTHTVDIFHHEF
jgi:glutamate racemase